MIQPPEARVCSIERKKEKKNPPLLYNLAELQNDCSRMFKISPDETLRIVQELYERRLVTYPRTDARVLSTAVAKEIQKNIRGLAEFRAGRRFCPGDTGERMFRGIEKTRYVNDKQITDHYAIIPTGPGAGSPGRPERHGYGVYALVVRRFLGIFYPPAVFQKVSLVTAMGPEEQEEKFFTSFRVLLEEGYLKVAQNQEKKEPG